jgi:hypothetical protein
MKTFSKFKIILALAAIFALGVASGSLVTARLRPAPAAVPAHAVPEERWQALTLADYEHRLSLTPDQVEKLKPIFGLTRRKLSTLRANTTERVGELLRDMNAQVAQELGDSQRAKLSALLQERRRTVDGTK